MENALHQPCVGGSNDWRAKPSELKEIVSLSTDPASVEAATEQLSRHTNHLFYKSNSYSVAASTDTRSAESLDENVVTAL